MKLVTIIVVSFNHSSFIIECLNSIKNQTYKQIQLIILDDNSSDNTVEIIKNWLFENKIKAICKFNQENIGITSTLNNSLKEIKGEYVKIISADDFLDIHNIDCSVSFLESNDLKYGMVCTDTWVVNSKSELLEDMADYNALLNIDKLELREKLVVGNRIAALTVLMKTDVLKITGLYDETLNLEDYDRWLRINEISWIGYIPEKLSFYRIHGNNESIIRKDKHQEDYLYLRMKYDKKGLGCKLINDEVETLYLNNKINIRIKQIYLKYPKRNFLMSLFIKLNINNQYYKFLKNIK